MLNQFEDVVVNKLVEKLNSNGINVNAETVKQALANSPQLAAQIEGILAANPADRKNKIIALITQSANAGGTATTTIKK